MEPVGLRHAGLRRHATAALLLATLAAAVFLAAWVGIEVTMISGRVAVIWLGNAFMVLWALKSPRARLPAILFAGFVANVAGDLAAGDVIADAVVLSAFNILEVLLLVLPLARFAREGDFSRPRTLLIFYGLALGPAPMVSALLAAIYLSSVSGAAFEQVLLSWYFGDALALVILVPPLVTVHLRDFARMFSEDERVVTILLFAGLAAVASIGYSAPGYPLAFLFFPVVLLMTFMRGFAGGTVGLMAAGAYLLVPTFVQHAPGVLTDHAFREQIIIIQTFGAVISFTVVLTGAALAERRRLEGEMAEAVKHAEQAREEAIVAKDASERANRTKSMFLANMSHELRTPLNAVIGFSEVMNGEMFGPLGDQKYRDYAQMIHEAGAHLLELINDILDMSKIEAGKFEIQCERFDAREIVGDCVALMQERAKVASVELGTEMPPGPLWISADRRALKQITLNLLSNAVKFTPAGGTVCAQLSRDSTRPEGPTCVLAVRDTGIGIPAEALKQLGNPFVQLRDGAAQTHQGTGLGLALVRSLTEMHRGAMRIESRQGAGTTVTVTIPVAQAAAAAA